MIICVQGSEPDVMSVVGFVPTSQARDSESCLFFLFLHIN